MFSTKEVCEKAYKDNGGIFSEEELLESDFNRLKDKNFILKSNKPNP